MQLPLLTMERTLELLDAAVTERGADFVYPEEWKVPSQIFSSTPGGDCVYVHDGKPACIVGWVLHTHGVTIEQLRQLEGDSVYALLLHLQPVLEVEPGVGTVLREAQNQQDVGRPWGVAVERARAAAVQVAAYKGAWIE